MSRNGFKEPVRPILNLPWTPLQVILGIAGFIVVCLLAAMLIYYWPEIPARIPTHFGISGRPDAWGSKRSLIYLAATGGGLYLMMLVLSRYPRVYNYPWPITETNAETQYRMASTLMIAMANSVIWIFAYLVLQTMRTAWNQAQGVGGGWFLAAVMLLTLGPLAVYLYAAGRARNRGPHK